MEGNPKDPYLKKHKNIFNIKTRNCLAFSGNGDKFQLMDDNHIVYLLQRFRNQGQRELNIYQESTLKEIQQLEYKPELFDNIILEEKYSIFKSKAFYFYNSSKEPYPQGVFEAEELLEENKDQAKEERKEEKKHYE